MLFILQKNMTSVLSSLKYLYNRLVSRRFIENGGKEVSV